MRISNQILYKDVQNNQTNYARKQNQSIAKQSMTDSISFAGGMEQIKTTFVKKIMPKILLTLGGLLVFDLGLAVGLTTQERKKPSHEIVAQDSISDTMPPKIRKDEFNPNPGVESKNFQPENKPSHVNKTPEQIKAEADKRADSIYLDNMKQTSEVLANIQRLANEQSYHDTRRVDEQIRLSQERTQQAIDDIHRETEWRLKQIPHYNGKE